MYQIQNSFIVTWECEIKQEKGTRSEVKAKVACIYVTGVTRACFRIHSVTVRLSCCSTYDCPSCPPPPQTRGMKKDGNKIK